MKHSCTNPSYPSVVKPSVVPPFDDPRFRNGIYSAHRLPQSFHELTEHDKPNAPTKAEIDAAVDKRVNEYLASQKANGDAATALAIAVRAQVTQENRAIAAENKAADLERQVTANATALQASEADKTELAAYRALGKPDELTTLKTRVGELEDKEAERSRDDLLRSVAEVTGTKFSVLKKLDKDTPGLDYEVREVAKAGSATVKEKQAFIKRKDGEKDVEEGFDAFEKREWSDFSLALRPPTAARPGAAPTPNPGGNVPSAEIHDRGVQGTRNTTRNAF